MRKRRGSLTVSKALDLLKLFLVEHEIAVSDAARMLRMDKSTVSRLLAPLENYGYVVVNPKTRRYQLGISFLHLAGVMYRRLDPGLVALPVMRRLRDASGETVTLQIRMGNIRVCIQQVPSPHDIRRVVELGQPLPLTVGSSGKILLAFLPDDELHALLEGLPHVRYTKETPSRSKFREDLLKVRLLGYATSWHERVDGVSGIAAPVQNYLGELVASLAISGPSWRWTLDRMLDFTPQLLVGASELSAMLGYFAREDRSEPALANRELTARRSPSSQSQSD